MVSKVRKLREVHERGILIGWQGQCFNAEYKLVSVFVPRREQDVKADQDKAVAAECEAAK